MRIGAIVLAALFTTSAMAGGLEIGSAGSGLAVPEQLTVGGYMDVIFMKLEDDASTFALGHFNPTLSAELADNLLVDAQLEWGSTLNGMNNLVGGGDGDLVYAYLDYTWKDSVILRAGQFLVPFGVYNTNLYAPTVAKLPAAPLPLVDIAPVKWSDVGLQLHGIIDTGTDTVLNYAVYVVNGLEAQTLTVVTADPATGMVTSTSTVPTDISDMRGNGVDSDSDKAFGGRLGGVAGPLEAGISGYSGAYDEAGNLDLTILGLDACLTYENFELRGEYAKADQDVGSSLDKDGFYIQGAYRFLEKYEAVARYDEADMDTAGSSDDRVTLGGNYFISDNLTLRVSYQFADIGGTDADGIIGQLAVDF